MMNMSEEEIKEYLDESIRYWRNERDRGGAMSDMSPFYIDAFQSVRISLFGKALPVEYKS